MDPSTEYLKHMTKDSVERTGEGSIHNPAPRLGSGGRFRALKNKLAKRPGVYDPAGLAAAIGRKKYGKKRMAKWAAAGRRRNSKGEGNNG